MSKKNKKKGPSNGGNGSPIKGMSSRCTIGILLCRLYGVFAPPKGNMSESVYFSLLQRIAFGQIKKKMGSLGQIWLDPEWPEDWESLMGLMLLPNIGTVAEYTAAVEKLSTLATASTTGGSSSELAQAGLTTSQVEEAQSWLGNTQDWLSQTFSGDWSGGFNSFTEGWNSFWGGNFT